LGERYTIKDLLTKKVKDNSGYTEFTWGSIEKGVITATDNKTNQIIAEYNFTNGRLKIL